MERKALRTKYASEQTALHKHTHTLTSFMLKKKHMERKMFSNKNIQLTLTLLIKKYIKEESSMFAVHRRKGNCKWSYKSMALKTRNF